MSAARQVAARGALRLAGRLSQGTRVESGPRMLEPLLVRALFGRVGSTLMMQLLGTSSEISFDRAYPSENQSLASLLYYLQPLQGSCGHTQRLVDGRSRAGVVARAGSVWVRGQRDSFGLLEPRRRSGPPLYGQRPRRLDGLLGGRGTVRRQPPLYYAEKYGGYEDVLTAAGNSHRMIDLVRDPRDMWSSVLAFDSKRGYFGFGRRRGAIRGGVSVIVPAGHETPTGRDGGRPTPPHLCLPCVTRTWYRTCPDRRCD